VSKRLYVGNLPYSLTEDDLREAFSEWEATDATIPIDEAGRSKGFGFVNVDDAQVDAAVEAMNGKEFRGRSLTVNEARPRPPRRSFGGGESYGGSESYSGGGGGYGGGGGGGGGGYGADSGGGGGGGRRDRDRDRGRDRERW